MKGGDDTDVADLEHDGLSDLDAMIDEALVSSPSLTADAADAPALVDPDADDSGSGSGGGGVGMDEVCVSVENVNIQGEQSARRASTSSTTSGITSNNNNDCLLASVDEGGDVDNTTSSQLKKTAAATPSSPISSKPRGSIKGKPVLPSLPSPTSASASSASCGVGALSAQDKEMLLNAPSYARPSLQQLAREKATLQRQVDVLKDWRRRATRRLELVRELMERLKEATRENRVLR